MKNLFLPFVVVALFAIGSCGDESVHPSVQQPIELKPVKIISFTPDTALRGKRVIITGENFSAFKDSNSVLLLNEWNRTFLLHVDSISPAIHPTQLFVSVSNDVSDFWQRSRIIVTTGTSSDTTQKKLFLKGDIVIEDTATYSLPMHIESLDTIMINNCPLQLLKSPGDTIVKGNILCSTFDYNKYGVKLSPIPVFKQDSENYSVSFRSPYEHFESGTKLTFTLDTTLKILKNIRYSFGCSYGSYPNSYVENLGCGMSISAIPYIIKGNTLISEIRGIDLQNSISNLYYKHTIRIEKSRSDVRYEEYNLIQMLPFTEEALIQFKFILRQ